MRLRSFYDSYYTPGNPILARGLGISARRRLKKKIEEILAACREDGHGSESGSGRPDEGETALLVNKADADADVFVIGNVGISATIRTVWRLGGQYGVRSRLLADPECGAAVESGCRMGDFVFFVTEGSRDRCDVQFYARRKTGKSVEMAWRSEKADHTNPGLRRTVDHSAQRAISQGKFPTTMENFGAAGEA